MALTANDPNYITKALIAQYLSGASDTSPVKSWSQGAARIVQGLMGGILAGRDQQDQQAAMSQLGTLLTPNTTASPPIPPPANAAPSSAQDSMLPASIRTNNPGAQWMGPVAAQYGATGKENLSGGNNAAVFPDATSGAAAQFGLLAKNYTGMPLSAAIAKWSGGNSSPQYVNFITKQTGLSPDTPISPELLASPQGVALAKAQAQWEAGRPYPLNDQAWTQAQSRALGGVTPAAAAPSPPLAGTNPQTVAPPLPPPVNVDSAALPPGAAPIASQPGAPQQIGIKQRIAQLLSSDNQYAQNFGQQLAIQAISPALSPPQFTTIGTDPYGNPIHGFVNPSTQSITPAGIVAGQNAAGLGTNIGQPQNSGLTGEDYLKTLPTDKAATIKAIAEGREPYPTGFILKTPYGQWLQNALNQYKPGLTAQDYSTIAQTRRNYTSGPAFNEIKAINTAIGHASKLYGYSEQMGGSDTAPALVNPVIQGAKNQFPQLDPNFQTVKKNYNALSETLAVEVSKALNGGKPHVAEIEHWRQIFSNADGPAQRRAAISSAMAILEGRTTPLQEGYTQGMKSAGEPINVISPENQKRFENLLRGRAPEENGQPTQSIGGVTPAAAGFTPPPNWQFSPSRKQYRDPQGNLYDQNGQLVK